MGIRFYCPNGHKLNVKEFQAGRRGICPYCGAKIQIPTQSTRPSSRVAQQQQRSESGGTAGEADFSSPPSATPPDEIVMDAPVGREAATVEPVVVGPAVAEVEAPGVTSAPESPAVTTPAGPGPSPVAPPHPVGVDPITEAPEMIWYVRPPSGGQFGPAAGDIMRSWLAEGRVSADSLLWREGWRDWQEAGSVFPQLRSGQPTALLEIMPVVSAVKPVAAPSRHARSRRHADGSQLTLIVMVSMAVVILLAVFLYVLFHQ